MAEGIDSPELYEAALRFFNGLKISGPVSHSSSRKTPAEHCG